MAFLLYQIYFKRNATFSLEYILEEAYFCNNFRPIICPQAQRKRSILKPTRGFAANIGIREREEKITVLIAKSETIMLLNSML